MGNVKLGFEEFAVAVDNDCVDFVTGLHRGFTDAGCKIEVKEAKSGYVASYLLNKKTVANYVFRKKGLVIRIYANHITDYMGFLDTLPGDMIAAIKKVPDCKRLLDPTACNSKCAMGYVFLLDGERFQKCRSNAFMFLVCEQSKPFIKDFLQHELAASN